MPAPEDPSTPSMQAMQEYLYSDEVDYAAGSPHLTHLALRETIVGHLRQLVTEQVAATGSCRVLEVGAGHGSFTDTSLGAGAHVTVTEMSRHSVEVLERRYRLNDRVEVIEDPDGEELFRRGGSWDVVVCIAVLHHIPDYLGFIERTLPHVRPGGALLSFADPLWYPRRSWWSMTADRTSFIAWRLFQGAVVRGVRSRLRRWKGVDESRPEDMVEYHVVRQGVDEAALAALLATRFGRVEVLPYWSTPSPSLQRLGQRAGWTNNFGVIAREASS